jgi:hypothetical protein
MPAKTARPMQRWHGCLLRRVLRSWVPLDILLGHHLRPDRGALTHVQRPKSRRAWPLSSQRKTAVVLRLLRSEDLELVSRELGITAASLSGWLDDFLAGGQAALKSRPADDRDDEIAQLGAKVGELTMDNELLTQRSRADRPFAPRRRRP